MKQIFDGLANLRLKDLFHAVITRSFNKTTLNFNGPVIFVGKESAKEVGGISSVFIEEGKERS